MLDAYSIYPAPPPEVIAKKLVEHFNNPEVTYEVALQVAKEMPEYSLIGYSMFGFKQCCEKIEKKILFIIK